MYGWIRTYLSKIWKKIANGLELEDGEIHADAISYAKAKMIRARSVSKFTQGVTVSSVVFSNHWAITWLNWIVYILPVLQKKNLGRGKWRYLNEREVNALRMGGFRII